MRCLPILLLLLTAVPVWGQEAELSVEPAAIVKEIVADNLDESFEDRTVLSVTNNSRRTMRLVHSARGIRQPSAWSNLISGRGTRTAPYSVRPDSDGDAFPLGPGETAVFEVTLRPDGIAGAGRLLVSFSDLTNPGRVVATASIATKIVLQPSLAVEDVITHRDRPASGTVRLYPNPAKERFFVEAPRGTKIGRVEVVNTLGRQLKRYTAPDAEGGYNIESLPDGLYLITIYDENDKQLRTLRLLHRQFGA